MDVWRRKFCAAIKASACICAEVLCSQSRRATFVEAAGNASGGLGLRKGGVSDSLQLPAALHASEESRESVMPGIEGMRDKCIL